MSPTKHLVRRALLYGMVASPDSASPFAKTDLDEVPGSSHRMLAKTQGLKVDCVAYDLEDSVVPAKKAEARMNVCRVLHEPRALNITERAVRVNPIGSKWAEHDLRDVVTSVEIIALGKN